MTGEYFRLALLCALGLLLVGASVTDLRSRIISNRLNLSIAAMAPLWWLANGLPLWPGMAAQLALAVAVFAIFAALFALGCMGGGDVKMLGALALWFPWQALLSMLMVMAVLGGVVTIVTVVHHRMTRRLGQPQIPYGVAISVAALWLIGERYLNQFA
ncbi:peptidase [Sphingobium quisquiliarum P25]|uniref:Peptidase n=1 Tax=Sphingobium quisquiliarum P25 TaxID=1329909 RepID=T0H6L1_9SPHN|nr:MULTISPECIES: prepilin peptidase [Sphingobium]EQB11951.1 peptidase [Sphingobium quisquiliarum P25]EZP72646.1 Peptidase [Sphingomonas paucimobilis]